VSDAAPLGDTAEELFEEAPCGYVSTRLDGTVVQVNRTFERWSGLDRGELVGRRRFAQLLAPGGRIYYETHVAPLLMMQGAVREIAADVVRADGSRLPALLNATLRRDAEGRPGAIRITVFDATDRRRYEQELVRARRREQEIAQRLQRSLLAGRLPEAPGLDLEVVYRPAEHGLEVGGDWYDAFWLEEGAAIGLVVGDVVGRGLEAAATMGQLRSAVRALTSTGLPPGPALEALDAYSRRHDVGRMTTLVLARLDLAPGLLTYACGGHLPPVIARPGEAPQALWGGRSPAVDAHRATARPRGAGTCRLPPGSVLVLYTDGLVEARGRPVMEGVERLLREVDARRALPAAGLGAGVLTAMATVADQDDTCMVVVRSGDPAESHRP
jgi:phosphoserine phosphatase RsbU/P